MGIPEEAEEVQIKATKCYPQIKRYFACLFGDLTPGTPQNQFKIYRRNREWRSNTRNQTTRATQILKPKKTKKQ